MRFAVLVVLLLLAALGAAVALGWFEAGGGPAPAVVPKPVASVEEEAPTRLAGGSAVDPAPAARREAAPEPGTGANVAASPKGARRVRVRLAESGAPAVDARAWFFVPSSEGGLDYPSEQEADLLAWLERHGTPLRLNADATASVPEPRVEEPSPVFVGARTGSGAAAAVGWVEFEPRQTGTLDLWLSSRTTLTVEVRDSLGRPALGAPVWLWADGKGDGRVAARGETDPADGRWVVTDVAQRLAAAGARTADGRLPGGLSIPAALRLESVAVEGTALPAEPVVITLPPCGRVVVIAEHPQPERLEGGTVRLSVPTHQVVPRQRASLRAPLESGRAVFDWVGLGQALRLRVHLAGDSDAFEATAEGPRVEGGEVVVRIPTVHTEPQLALRLLLPSGEPAAERRFDVLNRTSSGNSTSTSSFSASTNADGWIYFSTHEGFDLQAERTLQLSDASDGLSLELAVPPLRPGENNLGEHRLIAVPLLVAGSVVDAAGEAVSGARVSVEQKKAYGARADQFYFDDVHGGSARTGDDGAFEVRGAAPSGALFVQATASGFLDGERQPVTAGAQGVRIELARGGVLTGSLTLPAALADPIVEARALRRDGEESERTTSHDGKFRLDPLTAGDYDVELRLLGHDAPIARLERVSVVAGETTDVGALEPSAEVRAIAFDVVDESGQPVASADAYLLPAGKQTGDGATIGGVPVTVGRGIVVTSHPVIDLLVTAKGYRARRVAGVRDGERIVLPPALDVTLQLPAGVAVPAGHQVEVILHRLDSSFATDASYVVRSRGSSRSQSGAVPWLSGLSAKIDADGRARWQVAEPGRYSWSWQVQAGDERRRITPEPAEFVIAEQRTPQTLTPTVTTEQLTVR